MCKVDFKEQNTKQCGSCKHLAIKRIACRGGLCKLIKNKDIYKLRKHTACLNYKRRILDDTGYTYPKSTTKYHKYNRFYLS